MNPTLHVVLVAFHNPSQTLLRWKRDILPALPLTSLPWRVTVVDNSPNSDHELQTEFRDDYHWMEGKNLQYGPSLNFAVARVPSDYVLYCCSRHGRMLSPTWIRELLAPLQADESVGMSGYLMGSNSPGGVAHDTHQEWVKDKFHFVDEHGNGYVPQHIQGGVFAARTKAMLELPYPPEIAHCYTDHIITWAMLKEGYKCVNVPTICSVWRNVVEKLDGLSYIHDESPESIRQS